MVLEMTFFPQKDRVSEREILVFDKEENKEEFYVKQITYFSFCRLEGFLFKGDFLK